MVEKPATCRGCPAEHDGKSFVRPIGPPDATLALLGQGPGETEAHNGMPFVGPSGQRLDSWLRRAGIDRSRCWVGNVVQCWLPGNRAPTDVEINRCRAAHWQPALDALPNLRVIVPIGVPAQRPYYGAQSGERNVGSVTLIREDPAHE